MATAEPHLGAVKRPKHLPPPAYLTPSPPVPKPENADAAAPPSGEQGQREPTRYGDWEKDGKAVDF